MQPFKICTNVLSYDDYADAPMHTLIEVSHDLYLEIKKQHQAIQPLDCYCIKSFNWIASFGVCENDGEDALWTEDVSANIETFKEDENFRADYMTLLVYKDGRCRVNAYEKHSGLLWESEDWKIEEMDRHFGSDEPETEDRRHLQDEIRSPGL